jgi:hypothetical protein
MFNDLTLNPLTLREVEAHMLIYLAVVLQPLATLATFQSLDPYAVGRTPWTGNQPVARPLPAHTTAQTQIKRTQISMPQMGFEPTFPAFERAKTVHASDHAVTVIGQLVVSGAMKYLFNYCVSVQIFFLMNRDADHSGCAV